MKPKIFDLERRVCKCPEFQVKGICGHVDEREDTRESARDLPYPPYRLKLEMKP